MKQTLTFDANEVKAIILDHVMKTYGGKVGDFKATIKIDSGISGSRDPRESSSPLLASISVEITQ